MHISQLKGFRDIKRMARNNNMHLDKLVSRILTEALFKSRSVVTCSNKTEYIDARYHKVVYFRENDTYLVIGRETKRMSWDNVPSSVKSMIKAKTIPVVIE